MSRRRRRSRPPPGGAALVAERVAKDIKGNLAAVRDHAESLAQNAVPLGALRAQPS